MTDQVYPNINTIKKSIMSSCFFENFVLLEEVDSTNDYAKKNYLKLNSGIIVAKKQSAGRGRLGKSWKSNFSGALTFSLLFDFKDLEMAEKIFKYSSLLSAEAIHKALMTFDDISKSSNKLTIKWPNDIISENKKICGILVEGIYEAETPKKLVIGIGLNIGALGLELKKDKDMEKASSIQEQYGFLPSADELFLRLTAAVSKVFLKGEPDFGYINSHSFLNGKEVSYYRDKDISKQEEKAKVLFIDDSCRLVVEDSFGNIRKIISANSVRIVED